MKKRFAGMMLLAVAATCSAWLLPTPAQGQGKAKYKAPRADDGKTANLQGIWIVDAWDTSRYSLEWHNGATGIRPGKSVSARFWGYPKKNRGKNRCTQ